MTPEELKNLSNGDLVKNKTSGYVYMIKTDILSLPKATIVNMPEQFELVSKVKHEPNIPA